MFGATGATERIVVAWAAATIDVKAAVAGKRIRVLGGLALAGAAGGTIKFQSHGAGDTDLSGAITVGVNGALFDRVEEAGYLETAKGEGLRVVVTGNFNGALLLQTID